MTIDTRANIRLAQLHLHDGYLAPPLTLVVAVLLTNRVPLAWAAVELLIIANYIRVYPAFKCSNAVPRSARRIAIAHGAHMLACLAPVSAS